MEMSYEGSHLTELGLWSLYEYMQISRDFFKTAREAQLPL